MIRLVLLLFLVENASCSITVMSFNMYHFGAHVHGGLRKIADQITYINPDVVALQEAGEGDHLETLCTMLGDDWSGALNTRGETDSRGLITRHKITGVYGGYSRGYNVRIQLRDIEQEISVWSLYLHWKDYGPYEARKGNTTTLEKILRGEYENRIYYSWLLNIALRTDYSRVHNIRELLENAEFVRQINNSDSAPVIVAGDFNTPSHLDWTEATKHIHFGWSVEWPVTKLLETKAGMADSFREVHSDPLAAPGLTWGVYDALVKDRIDFIFYRGPLRPIRSFPFSGTTPVLYPKKHLNLIKVLKINEWPSDHYAVVTEFEHRIDEVTELTTLATTTTTSTTFSSTACPPTNGTINSIVNESWSCHGIGLTYGIIMIRILWKM